MRQMNGLAKESAQEMAGYSLHMADSGTDNFDRDFALSLLSSDQDAVYEIEEALKRIERNTYGVCEMTGQADSARAAGGDSLDAVHRGGPGPIGARRRPAAAPPRPLGTVDSVGVAEVEAEDEEAEEKPTRKRNKFMPREIITIECTEARKEGKSPSRYTTTRNKKLQTGKAASEEVQPGSAAAHPASRNQVDFMPRKTRPDKPDRRGSRAVVSIGNPHTPARSPRLISPPMPSISRTSTCCGSSSPIRAASCPGNTPGCPLIISAG